MKLKREKDIKLALGRVVLRRHGNIMTCSEGKGWGCIWEETGIKCHEIRRREDSV